MRHIRNIIRYVILFMLNLYVMLAFHSYLNFIFLVILLAAPVLSYTALWLAVCRMEFTLGMPGVALTAGEEFSVCFQICNPLHIPLINAYVDLVFSNPFYGERQSYRWNLPVGAGRETEISYPFVMEHCGRVAVQAKELRLTDLLGLFSLKKAIDAAGECLILPCGRDRAQEVARAGLRGGSETASSREKGFDFSEVGDVREYRPGDLFRDIHWKLSVKKDELMVKERVGLADMQINVVLDTAGEDCGRTDALLALADGITRALVQQRLLFTVFYYSVSKDRLCEFAVADEAGRRQWLELLLYDRAGNRAGYARTLFEQEHPGAAFLYIGFDGGGAGAGAVFGEQGTAAVMVNG